MKKPRPPAPSNRHHAQDVDHAIWEAATETLDPLKKRKGRVHEAVERAKAGKAPNITGPAVKRLAGLQHRLSELQPLPAPQKKKPPPLADFDAKHARRIGTGKSVIDRRIDLHGMRQSEAHGALRRFLFGCHADGLRMVLVITGKGGPPVRDADSRSHWSEREERGVLKRNVPHWLAEPELRAIVVSFTTAAVRHGGEGALYVHLRRRDRAG